jgi:hypothetical protein
MVIRRIDVVSAAKVTGTLYAVLGLIAGIIIALISAAASAMQPFPSGDEAVPALIGALFGVGAVIVLPILYGVMGAVLGALTAWIYNILSGLTGGLAIEVE